MLVNVTGGLDMTLLEVDEAANAISGQVDPEANIIFGAAFDPALDGRIRVSVVATGMDGASIAAIEPYEQPRRKSAPARIRSPAQDARARARPRTGGHRAGREPEVGASLSPTAQASAPPAPQPAPVAAQPDLLFDAPTRPRPASKPPPRQVVAEPAMTEDRGRAPVRPRLPS